MTSDMAAMGNPERLRAELGDAMSGAKTALAAADKLCQACVDLLEVDGASISLMYDGTTRGTFGSSGELSRRLDELQFTYGEGPCLDTVRDGSPVLVPDFNDRNELRWPAFAEALLDSGVCAVFAFPVAVARDHVGALDLFRRTSGSLSSASEAGAVMVAELAALPLLDLMTADVDWDAAAQGADGWGQLASLERVEVYQATGMIIASLDVSPAEAVVLLRAHAIAHNMTASEVAWEIVERRLALDIDGWRGDPGNSKGTK
jgi:GAF domain-containing protein/ANTAR domain-containing protein